MLANALSKAFTISLFAKERGEAAARLILETCSPLGPELHLEKLDKDTLLLVEAMSPDGWEALGRCYRENGGGVINSVILPLSEHALKSTQAQAHLCEGLNKLGKGVHLRLEPPCLGRVELNLSRLDIAAVSRIDIAPPSKARRCRTSSST